MTAVAPYGDDEPDAPKYGGPANIQRAWSRMAGESEDVAGVLVEIAKYGASEPARVAAATTLLKFVGFGNTDELRIRVVPSQYDEAATPGAGVVSARQVIENRMKLLREPAYNPDDADPMIVDAEIVDPDE